VGFEFVLDFVELLARAFPHVMSVISACAVVVNMCVDASEVCEGGRGCYDVCKRIPEGLSVDERVIKWFCKILWAISGL
jgi:hypothetical protein